MRARQCVSDCARGVPVRGSAEGVTAIPGRLPAPRAVWMNPDPPQYWAGGTCEVIRQVFPMYHLTIDGLGEAVGYLSKGAGFSAG